MKDLVSIATEFAIKRAKRRKSSEVDKDDLLVGLLQAVGRFDIAKIGALTFDLEELEEVSAVAPQDENEKSNKQKVAYDCGAIDILDRAGHIARKEDSSKVELVHLLAAFAYEDDGLMAHLKEKYRFSSTEWRSALAEWQPAALDEERAGSEPGGERKSPLELNQKQFFSPDEAAEFLDVHTQTIRGYIRSGKLPALRLAGERALRIQREDLLALLEPYKPE